MPEYLRGISFFFFRKVSWQPRIEFFFNLNDATDFFARSTLGCWPERRLKPTSGKRIFFFSATIYRLVKLIEIWENLGISNEFLAFTLSKKSLLNKENGEYFMRYFFFTRASL